MTDSSKKNTQENQLDMSKIWSYIRCYFYVIFGYHLLFIFEESTGEKFYNLLSLCIFILFAFLAFVIFLSYKKINIKVFMGIVVIILYILFLIYKEFVFDLFKKIQFLALNDLGDFLSGVFAPLAFVFLYFSYKQLQQQLKIANDTLEEQKKQTKESEQQLKEQLKIAKETLDEQKKQVEISAYPLFYFDIDKDKITLINAGESVVNVQLYAEDNIENADGKTKKYNKKLDKMIGVMKTDDNKDIQDYLYEFLKDNRVNENVNSMRFRIEIRFKTKTNLNVIQEAFIILEGEKISKIIFSNNIERFNPMPPADGVCRVVGGYVNLTTFPANKN